jgi:hypothetical protein
LVEVRPPDSDTFQVVTALADARIDATTTLLIDGRVLVVGGSDGADPLSTAELLDLSGSDHC